MIPIFGIINKKKKEEEKFKIPDFTPLGLKASATGGATLTKPSLGLPNLGLPTGPMSKPEMKPKTIGEWYNKQEPKTPEGLNLLGFLDPWEQQKKANPELQKVEDYAFGVLALNDDDKEIATIYENLTGTPVNTTLEDLKKDINPKEGWKSFYKREGLAKTLWSGPKGKYDEAINIHNQMKDIANKVSSPGLDFLSSIGWKGMILLTGAQTVDMLLNSPAKIKDKFIPEKEMKQSFVRIMKSIDPETGNISSSLNENDLIIAKYLRNGALQGKTPEMIKVMEQQGGFKIPQQVNIFGGKLYAGLPADEIVKSIIAVGKVTNEMVQGLDPVKVSQVTQQLLNTSPALASAFLKAVEKPEVIPKAEVKKPVTVTDRAIKEVEVRKTIKEINKEGGTLQLRVNPKFSTRTIIGDIDRDPFILVGKNIEGNNLNVKGNIEFISGIIEKYKPKVPITPELPKAEEPKKVEPNIEEKPKTAIPKELEPLAEEAKENDVFYVDVKQGKGINKVEVIKNPTYIQKEQLEKEFKKDTGYSANTEIAVRKAFDKYGNEYIWRGDQSTHKEIRDWVENTEKPITQATGKVEATIPVTEKTAGVEAPAPVKKIIKQEVIPKNIVKNFTHVEREFQIKPTKNIENPVTQDQITQARSIANNKNMIVEGRIRAPYSQVAKLLTDKTSIRSMTFEEADTFINALNILPTRGERLPPRTPSTIEEITPEFINKIPTFKEIGVLEKGRPSRRVFQKIGLFKEVFEPTFKAGVESIEELSTFRKDVTDLRKSVTPSKEVSTKIFNALEHPNLYKDLSVKEKKVADWARIFWDDWADRLGLTKEERLDNYVTHIFEKQIEEDLRNKFPLDPNLVQALDFITPKTIFNPFLQHRIGKTTGLKQDIWSALDAYEGKALKKFYYEPIIQRIRIYVKYLPESSSRYLRDFILRMSGRPLIIDKEVNQSLKEAAEHIKNLPYGKKLATFLTQGNASGMMAYSIAGLYYESYLGLNPAPAIKNASQGFLTIAETGIEAYVKTQTTLGKKRSEMLKDSIVFRSRKAGNLPGIDETFIKQLDSKRRKVTMFLFNIMETKNVGDAYLSGYYEAEEKGLSKEWCIKRGDEVAAKTQFLYGKLSAPQLTQNAIGRVLGVLTTWTENWLELMNDWVQGKSSEVYKEYEKTTGKKITPTNWFARRKSLWIYMGIVAMAMYIERTNKRIKAVEYTGWNTIRNIANLVSGELAGLRIFGAAAKITSGILTGDKALIKTGWNEIRPDRFISIIKKLEDIVNGKKDWLSIFFDLNKEKKKAKPEPIVIGKPSISKFTIPKFGKSNISKFSIPKFGK